MLCYVFSKDFSNDFYVMVIYFFFCYPKAKSLISISLEVLLHWLQDTVWVFSFTILKQLEAINIQVCASGS